MNPWQLSKSGSESGEQMALFCWAAKAQAIGFAAAMNEDAYKLALGIPSDPAIPELKWLFHIPNGGSRGDTARSRAIEGGRMKAEGVKPGILDVAWLLARPKYAGLLIEMKKPSLKSERNKLAGLSAEQLEFGNFAMDQQFCVRLCYTWTEAAKVVQSYYEGTI